MEVALPDERRKTGLVESPAKRRLHAREHEGGVVCGEVTDRRGSGGVDVAFDPVGGPYTEQALRSMAWGGRLLVVGFAAGAIPSVPLNLALLKGCAILGVFWGEFTERQPAAYEDSIRRLGEWYRAGQLRPHISLRLPLKDAALALRRMEERRVTGKAVLTVGSA